MRNGNMFCVFFFLFTRPPLDSPPIIKCFSEVKISHKFKFMADLHGNHLFLVLCRLLIIQHKKES